MLMLIRILNLTCKKQDPGIRMIKLFPNFTDFIKNASFKKIATLQIPFNVNAYPDPEFDV